MNMNNVQQLCPFPYWPLYKTTAISMCALLFKSWLCTKYRTLFPLVSSSKVFFTPQVLQVVFHFVILINIQHPSVFTHDTKHSFYSHLDSIPTYLRSSQIYEGTVLFII
uniref:Uncharacterized protein n=1 Tax=Cacopsylla melanoneura TaxID=428564 RepID=A0A8D9A5G1_9HEMI